jgi:hypothetical protein
MNEENKAPGEQALHASKRAFSQAIDGLTASLMASANDQRPKWSQDEAIAFECARECIGHLIAIHVAARHSSEQDEARCAELDAEIDRLSAERRSLHVHDVEDIARIRRDYGQRIRQLAAKAAE